MSLCPTNTILLLCLMLLATSHDLLEARPKPPVDPQIAEVKLQLREQALDLREEMYSLMGGSQDNLSWIVRELVREVQEYKGLVTEQGKVVENMMLEHVGVVEELKWDVKTALDELESLKENQESLKENQESLKMRMDVVRSEVRLISQHKLTWQNSTAGNRHYSDFVVDGVYRMTHDEAGMNPISHTEDGKVGPNMVISIDLGALFKIHTVKLWKRTHTCCDNRFVGLLIYADGRLIGVTSDVQYLYNFRVNGDVYATKIVIKQPLALTVNFLEIQVFGNGPYSENEV